MTKNGKLIIEIGLTFEDPKTELERLKACLSDFYSGPRKILHNDIRKFFSEVSEGLDSKINYEPFIMSIQDPDDPEEEDPN